MTAIFEELIDTHADKFAELENKILFKHPHDFLFVDHDSQRMFNNWTQEITYEDKDVPSLWSWPAPQLYVNEFRSFTRFGYVVIREWVS